MSTSTKSSWPIFRNPCELSERVLPTYFDVIKCYMHERQLIKQKSKKEPLASEILDIIPEKLNS